MQAQAAAMQAMEQYAMLDFGNVVLRQCWDVCYDSNLTREQLATSTVPDAQIQKMEACARKCVNREFEVLQLIFESAAAREKEQEMMMAGNQ